MCRFKYLGTFLLGSWCPLQIHMPRLFDAMKQTTRREPLVFGPRRSVPKFCRGGALYAQALDSTMTIQNAVAVRIDAAKEDSRPVIVPKNNILNDEQRNKCKQLIVSALCDQTYKQGNYKVQNIADKEPL